MAIQMFAFTQNLCASGLPRSAFPTEMSGRIAHGSPTPRPMIMYPSSSHLCIQRHSSELESSIVVEVQSPDQRDNTLVQVIRTVIVSLGCAGGLPRIFEKGLRYTTPTPSRTGCTQERKSLPIACLDFGQATSSLSPSCDYTHKIQFSCTSNACFLLYGF